MPGAGRKRGLEGELVGVAEPSPQRRAQHLLQAAAHEQERRRPGPAVQVLVGAAHRQVGPGRRQVDRHHPCRVAEIPQHQGAVPVGGGGDPRQVGEGGGPVGGVGQADEGHAVVEGGLDLLHGRAGHGVALHQAQFPAALGGQAGQHVAVGGEVGRVGHQGAAAGEGVESRRGQAMQVGRGGVGHQHLVGGGADERSEAGPDAGRQVDPVLPGLHQAPAPVVLHHPAQGGGGGSGQAAQGVAVHVDGPAGGEHEALAEPPQRVGAVEGLGVGAGDHPRQRYSASTRAPARVTSPGAVKRNWLAT